MTRDIEKIKRPLVLASASKARRALLAQAGLPFIAQAADIDEGAVLRGLQEKMYVSEIAVALAELKARAVAADKPGALVIGADQILVCEGRLYQKAETREEARAQLKSLRHHPHQLVSAVCVVCDGEILWQYADTAHLTMKDFSDGFLERYLNAAGDAVFSAVGGYELEGLGAWLFERIEGDYFTILGLPLLPLLQFLDGQGFGP